MYKTITVIVPVYNVEAYLPQCLESVISQDYRDLEIILIDDGSKDSSGIICDEYAQKDSRIRVIHQENAGSGAAKNAGLRIATGEYLTFLDSDDYLESGAYSHMVSCMEENQADVVQCVLQYVFRDHTEIQCFTRGKKEYNVLDYLGRFTDDWTCALMTDKLFKRSLFDGIFFEEGNIIDDEYFTYQGIMNAQKIIYDDRIVYNYRQRCSSVMNASSSGERILMNRMDFLEKRRKNIIQKFPELKRHFNESYLTSLAYMIYKPYHTEKTIHALRAGIKNYFRERNWDRPSILLIPKLLYICFAPTCMLLNRGSNLQQHTNIDIYYS